MANRKARRQVGKLGARARPGAPSPAAEAYAIGVRSRAAGRTLEALDAFERVLILAPQHPGALYHLGAIAWGAGRLESAKGFFTRAAAADPLSAELHLALGGVLHALGERDGAADALDRALDLQPDDADTWMNLGNIRREQNRLTAAEAAGRRAVTLGTGSALAWRNLAVTLQAQGRVAAAIDAYERALALDPLFREAQSGRLFCLNYDEGRSAADVAEDHRRWGKALQARTPVPPREFTPAPDPSRRLRVGYVSGDLHAHPVGYFLADVLQAHDRSAVEVVCYSHGGRDDAVSARLRAAADQWRDLAGLDDAGAATAIRADAIDVLIDLSGHTAHGRLALFAHRPAPVQASWLGYVATTGLPAMDYLLTDAETAPPGAEALFTETLLRSPAGRFCYAPPAYAPPVAPPPSLTGAPFTFGSFNDVLKIGPRAVRLWSAVLAAVPGARLRLKWSAFDDAGVCERFVGAFREAGVDPARLALRGYSPHADMLAEYAAVDVALDPPDFSGGMTTCEALWMGAPVITLPEQKPASRQTLSFLTRIGLTELVAASEADYVGRAVALANDPDRLAALRAALRPRMQASPVRQPAAFTAAHEALIRQMWRAWCERSVDG